MIKVDKILIEEFRGIRSLEIQLNGQNFAVAGPNGTGKSGIVDALEFALTGSISRLTGKGRGDLSVKEHGPHVDSRFNPEKAKVTLDITIPSIGKKARIVRSVKAARRPTVTPDNPEILRVLTEIEQHPEVALSRREIIKYVLAEPGERAKEVQALLQLNDLEVLRERLQRIANAAEREVQPLAQALTSGRDALIRAMGIPEPSKEAVLAAANERRAILSLPPLPALEATTSLRDGLESQESGSPIQIAKTQATADILAARQALQDFQEATFSEQLTKAKEAILLLRGDEAKLQSVARQGMLKTAIELFDGKICPVCETEWNAHEFREAVTRQLTHLEAISQERKATEALLLPISKFLGQLKYNLDSCRPYGPRLNPAIDLKLLSAICENISKRIDSIQKFLPLEETIAAIDLPTDLFTNALSTLDALEEAVRSLPEPNERDKARDYLTVADERLSGYRIAASRHRSASRRASIARRTFDIYAEESNNALASIYKEVEAEFQKFYRLINADDEAAFEAQLRPSIGKLGFDVEFYGRGFFPPGAYHSEGHQDAMGLCLYLALMRYLLGDSFTFAVLDDVLMSVDRGHRRAVCTLLKTAFPSTQFVLTTHDGVWLRLMGTVGLIKPKAALEFRKWDVAHGPMEWKAGDVWDEINGQLDKNDVRAAAGLLRHHLEYISGEFSDLLGGKVEYRGDGRYELGDLLPAAVSALKDLFKKAKSSASSWKKQEILEQLNAREQDFSSAFQATQADQWQVNPAIHYNAWADFTKEDFMPVVAAYKEFERQFRCSSCNEYIYVVADGHKKNMLRCACGETAYNLVAKSAS